MSYLAIGMTIFGVVMVHAWYNLNVEAYPTPVLKHVQTPTEKGLLIGWLKYTLYRLFSQSVPTIQNYASNYIVEHI